MALAHSRGTLCAAPGRAPRITVVAIRSAPNAAACRQTRLRAKPEHPESTPDNFLFFLTAFQE